MLTRRSLLGAAAAGAVRTMRPARDVRAAAVSTVKTPVNFDNPARLYGFPAG
jgi:hypothetical protein